MNSKSKVYFLGLAATLIALLSIGLLLPEHSPENQVKSPVRVSQPSLLAAGSGASEAPAPALAVHAASQPGSRRTQHDISPFVDHKGSLRALANAAVNSSDPMVVEYAKLYLFRCRMHAWSANLREWTKSPEAMLAANPKAAEQFRKFRDFCGDVSTVTDRGLEYALNATLTKLDVAPIDINRPRNVDLLKARIQESISQQTGDLLVNRVRDLTIDPEALGAWLVESGIAKQSEIGSRSLTSFMATHLVQAASCELWGCDESLLRMSLCISNQLCSDAAMSAPLDEIFAAQYVFMIENRNPGDNPTYPSWQELKRRAIDSLRR